MANDHYTITAGDPKVLLDFVFAVFAKPYAYHVVLIQGRGLYYHKVKRGSAGNNSNAGESNSSSRIGLPKFRRNGAVASAANNDYTQYAFLHWQDIVGCHCMRDPVSKTDSASASSPAPSDSDARRTTTVTGNNDRRTTAAATSSPATNKNKAYFCVYAYPLRKKPFGKGLKRQRLALTLTVDHLDTFVENLKFATRWRDAIRLASNEVRPPSVAEHIVTTTTTTTTENGSSTGPAHHSHTLHPIHPPPAKRLLIFVNPKSGPGKALWIFQHRVAPLLAEAAVVYELIITTRQNGAYDHVKSVDLNLWDGIVIVSGDGLIFEVINGLMQRDDWRNAIKIPLGVVPGGSGNGLAKAISHALGEPSNSNPILFSAYTLVKTQSIPMDIVRVVNSSRTIYSFLSVGWGLISDIDIESERFRSLGETRFTLWAMARVANLKVYRGRLSYLPFDRNSPTNVLNGNGANGTTAAQRSFQRAHSSYEAKQQANRRSDKSGDIGRRIAASKSLPDHLNVRYDDDEDEDGDSSSRDLDDGFCIDALELSPTSPTSPDAAVLEAAAILEADGGRVSAAEECIADEDLRTFEQNDDADTLLVPLDQPLLDHRWIQREDDYVMVYLVYQTHISTSAFVAPEATMSDGIIWMMVIRKGVSRAQLASFMLSLENGSHIKHSCMEMIPVRAFRLEPMTGGGHVTVDGEAIEYGPVQGEVMPSMARIMSH